VSVGVALVLFCRYLTVAAALILDGCVGKNVMPAAYFFCAKLVSKSQSENIKMQSKSKKCDAQSRRLIGHEPCNLSRGNRHLVMFHGPTWYHQIQKGEVTQQTSQSSHQVHTQLPRYWLPAFFN
jgi:hypothetical protein